MKDVTLVSMWNEGVQVNPLYHFLRLEIEKASRTITNHRLVNAGKSEIKLKDDESEVIRYRKKYPFAPALLAIGASLIEKDFSVNFLSLDVEREKRNSCEDWLEKTINDIIENTKLAVLISVVTPEVEHLSEFCKKLKAKRKDLKVIVGGVHATYYDTQMLHESDIDIVCRGEGELVVTNLLDAIKSGRDFSTVKGITFKSCGKILRNEDQPMLTDLKTIPIPAYNELSEEMREKIILTPTFSRGCPYGCSYCVESHFWHVMNRHKDPIKFVKELEILNKEYNISFIHIADSTFGLDKNALQEFCDELERKKLNCYFSINIRPDVFEYLGEYWIKRLLNLNFVEFCMGVESSSMNTIQSLKRNQKENDVYNTLKRLKELKVPLVKLYLMIGSPGDNHISLFNTIMTVKQYLQEELIVYATGKYFVPAPGTPLFDDMKIKIENNWNLYNRYNFPPIYESSELTAPELESYLILLQAVQLNQYEKYLSLEQRERIKKNLREFSNKNYMKEMYF